MSEEKISLREYARRLGVSDTAVRKAIKAGKIVKGVVRKDGKPFIVQSVADAEWRENHKPTMQVTQSGKHMFAETANVGDKASVPSSSEATFAAAKRAKAVYDAKLAELEFKKKSGSLVDKNEVYKALYGAGQEMRAAFTSIPDRVIDDLLACKNRHEAHQKLTDAIYEALETFTNIEKRDITSTR